MIELTEQQQHELRRAQDSPPRLVNPKTNDVYVLLPQGLFERVRAVLEEEDEIASIEEMYPLVSQALDEGEEVAKESA